MTLEKTPIESMQGTQRTDSSDLGGGAGSKKPDEAHRIGHEKDMYDRERELFCYAKKLLLALFIFSYLFAIVIVVCIARGTTPWVITIGTFSMLVPAVLLGRLLHHVYGKETDASSAVKDFFEKSPAAGIFKTICEGIATAIRPSK